MINSLFMLGSSYNKNRKISCAFMFGWILYMMIENKFMFENIFIFINASIFFILSLLINSIKNEKANTILSIGSILIWSIIVDTICYFMYPTMNIGLDLLSYVWQGILFNYKYIFSNMVAVCVIYGLDLLIDRIVILVKTKEKVIV